MERITKKYYPEMTLDFCTEVDCLARPFCPGLKKNNRLYEYEETGLTPEEIVKMQQIIERSEMPRLIIPESETVMHGEPVVFYGGKAVVGQKLNGTVAHEFGYCAKIFLGVGNPRHKRDAEGVFHPAFFKRLGIFKDFFVAHTAKFSMLFAIKKLQVHIDEIAV